jgi:hypothetical protein
MTWCAMSSSRVCGRPGDLVAGLLLRNWIGESNFGRHKII